MSPRQQVGVRKNDSGHGAPAAHQVVLLRFVARSLGDQGGGDPVHVKVEILVCVHVRRGGVRLCVFVSPLGVHAVQLILSNALETGALIQLSL
jgi:hypothetical protein